MGTSSQVHPRRVQTERPRARDPLLLAGISVVAVIWLAVLAISMWAPDNVSGTFQEHVPVAAILTWIWGLIASRTFIVTLIRHRDRRRDDATVEVLSAAVIVVWVIAAFVGVFGPELVTGTDPSRVPIAALIAPIAAMVLTTTACQLVGVFAERDAGNSA